MEISLNSVRDLLLQGPVLVIGPGATSYPNVEADCLEELQNQFKAIPTSPPVFHYYDFAETSIRHTAGDSRESIRSQVEQFFRTVKPNPQLASIARARWTAAISLVADDHFPTALANHLDSTVTSWTVTRISDPTVIAEPKSIPVFQLLGDLNSRAEAQRVAIFRSEYLLRRRSWRKLLRTLPDFAKGDPLFFAGTNTIQDRVLDFINELLDLGPSLPRRLIFLADDSLASDPRLDGLVRDHCEVQTVRCTLGEFCEITRLDRLSPDIGKREGSKIEGWDLRKLLMVEDQVAIVPRVVEKQGAETDRHRLLDILFSPTNLDWGPYSAELDFSRDTVEVLKRSIEKALEVQGNEQTSGVLLKGEAGAGKTVLMRRTAFDLAQKGCLVLWVRKGLGLLSGSRFETVMRTIEAALPSAPREVYIFYDDPYGGRFSTAEVFSALAGAKVKSVLIIALRYSDLARADEAERSYFQEQCENVEIPNEFTRQESERLPDYLVTLGAAKDAIEARSLLATFGRRATQTQLFQQSTPFFRDSSDILCTLWYLLPQTRAAISESLTNEYLRLGGIEAAIHRFADAHQDQHEVARTAYELVTTTSGLGIALPVEVLVASLGVPYESWSAMCSARKPLWGLLYTEPYAEAQTYGFRTRNHVVTRVLLSILNGGGISHGGEFRCLKRLVAACTSPAMQYREFLCDVLIRQKDALTEKFTYEEGLELFDLAIESFPIPDRTIQHHRALWVKDVGRLPLEAYNALQGVQRVPVYPHSRRAEPLEHIHTSMAACALQAVTQGQLDILPGVDVVKQHISQASTPYLFDLHSQHVHANTLIKLAAHVRESQKEAFVAFLDEATRIIDRAMLVVDPLPEASREFSGAARMFSSLRAEVAIAFAESTDVLEAALKLYSERGNQQGFVLAARLQIAAARNDQRESGKRYKRVQDFINETMARIERDHAPKLPELYLCRAQLMIVWRVLENRALDSWASLRDDLKIAITIPSVSRDPIWLFYLAVAHFHLGETAMAEALFSQLRQVTMSSMLRSPFRCFYVGPSGGPKTFQGSIRTGGKHRFIMCQELDTDVMARDGEFRQADGATVHFRVAFSMLGPLAFHHGVESIRAIER